ncbi:monovalent cation:proton antiporter-2 (CPA2) family protein [Sphingomonas rosea]|uniref:Monovalent cation:proton antiporter-2 (CPA2) family protein n=1 Tax=Sphingomonas rosea TaxID=335605 RepID=A0ABP7U915_9SPHN
MTNFLTWMTILLGLALFFVMLFRRLGLGATLGYIVGGIVAGPYVLNVSGDAEAINRVSEIGIALLLFLVGLELQPSRLWRLKREIFGLGLGQLLAAGAALAVLVHLVLGIGWGPAAAIGLALGLSSTAQVLPMLRSTGELNSPYGERAFSILLLQDLALIPLITLTAALSVGGDPDAPSGLEMTGLTLAAIVGLVLAGRFVVAPLYRLIGRLGERELFIVAGLTTVIGAAALMHALHLSVALGAFVAGVMLAESPYRHELESDVEPFRSILLGLFFMSVGMLLDLSVIASEPLTVIGLAAAVIALKTAVLYPIARGFGSKPGRAITLAMLLSQAGEFGFVLFASAAAGRMISQDQASLLGAVVTCSMATTPFLMRAIGALQRRQPDKHVDLDGPEFSPETNAIIVGYGRFGQTVAQMLMGKRVPVTLIDLKASQIELAGEFGVKVYYGDGTRIDLLRTAGAGEAEAILFCHDDPDFGPEQLAPLLEAFPQASVMVRVFDRRQAMALDGLDVRLLQREVFESAVAMGRAALDSLGIADREIVRVEQAYRRLDDERLRAQSATGNLHEGMEKSFAHQPLDDEGVAAAKDR